VAAPLVRTGIGPYSVIFGLAMANEVQVHGAKDLLFRSTVKLFLSHYIR
jgi:hypothetical protein